MFMSPQLQTEAIRLHGVVRFIRSMCQELRLSLTISWLCRAFPRQTAAADAHSECTARLARQWWCRRCTSIPAFCQYAVHHRCRAWHYRCLCRYCRLERYEQLHTASCMEQTSERE